MEDARANDSASVSALDEETCSSTIVDDDEGTHEISDPTDGDCTTQTCAAQASCSTDTLRKHDAPSTANDKKRAACDAIPCVQNSEVSKRQNTEVQHTHTTSDAYAQVERLFLEFCSKTDEDRQFMLEWQLYKTMVEGCIDQLLQKLVEESDKDRAAIPATIQKEWRSISPETRSVYMSFLEAAPWLTADQTTLLHCAIMF